MNMQISRNGPALWDAILDVVGPHWSPIVAGGAIRDFYLGIEPKDIDVFVPAEFDEDLVSIIEQMPKHLMHGKFVWINSEADTGALTDVDSSEGGTEYSGAGFAPELIGVWEGDVLGLPVNIIGRRSLEDGAGVLINQFDFDAVKGYHTATGHMILHPKMVDDLDRKTATLAHSQTYQQSLRRFEKFNARHPGLLRLRNPFANDF